MNIAKKLNIAGIAISFAFAISAPADAVMGFQDEYDPSNWTLNGSGGNVDITDAPNSITLIKSEEPYVDYTVTSAGEGTVSFNYTTNLEGEDDFVFVDEDSPNFVTDTNQTGSYTSSPLSEGETFGFGLSNGAGNVTTGSSVTISNFSAPDATAVPFEFSPGMGILLVFGVVGGNWMKKKLSTNKSVF